MRFALTPSWIATAVLLVVITLAMFRIPFMRPAEDSVAWATGTHRILGNVVEIKRGESTAQVTLGALTIDDATKLHRILVTAPRDLLPDIGDRVSVTCNVEAPEPFDGFAYDKYLAIRGVYGVCRVNDPPIVVIRDADRTVATAFAKLRASFIAEIGASLPEPHATLLAGLLIGDARFSDAWRTRFMATGTSHIVAASGFNVGIVVLVGFTALTFFGVRRQHAFWLLALAIVSYVVLAGMSPAVVRAGVMGGLVLLAKKLGRNTTMRNVVLLAVAAMLTLEPRLALYDVGFQLSVVSTVALIWVGPRLVERMKWIPTSLDLREIFASTLAATLCTLPIVILSFGAVSLVGPFVNLLVLPFVPFAMGWGAAGLLVGAAVPSHYVMLPAWGLLSAMLGIIRATASVSLQIAIPFSLRVGLAVALALLIFLLLWRKKLFVDSSRRS